MYLEPGMLFLIGVILVLVIGVWHRTHKLNVHLTTCTHRDTYVGEGTCPGCGITRTRAELRGAP